MALHSKEIFIFILLLDESQLIKTRCSLCYVFLNHHQLINLDSKEKLQNQIKNVTRKNIAAIRQKDVLKTHFSCVNLKTYFND